VLGERSRYKLVYVSGEDVVVSLWDRGSGGNVWIDFVWESTCHNELGRWEFWKQNVLVLCLFNLFTLLIMFLLYLPWCHGSWTMRLISCSWMLGWWRYCSVFRGWSLAWYTWRHCWKYTRKRGKWEMLL